MSKLKCKIFFRVYKLYKQDTHVKLMMMALHHYAIIYTIILIADWYPIFIALYIFYNMYIYKKTHHKCCLKTNVA